MMTPALLRKHLGRGAVTRIARSLALDPSTVSHVIAGRIRSARIEAEIARRVRVRRDVLFPLERERLARECATAGCWLLKRKNDEASEQRPQ